MARVLPKGDAGTTPDDRRAAQAIGVSRGGLTTRIVAMVDQGGPRAGFMLTPGNGYGPHSWPDLRDGAPTNELIADKAYDTNDTLWMLEKREIAAVTPSRANRKAPRRCDPGVYGMRHLVANRFAARKEFRGGNAVLPAGIDVRGLRNLVSALVALREAVYGRPAGGRPAVNRPTSTRPSRINGG